MALTSQLIYINTLSFQPLDQSLPLLAFLLQLLFYRLSLLSSDRLQSGSAGLPLRLTYQELSGVENSKPTCTHAVF
jgi:hypothetical protein